MMRLNTKCLAALFCLLAIFNFAPSVSAQTDHAPSRLVSATPPATNGNRFLFIVDTSVSMKKTATEMRQTVEDIIRSSANGQMRRGDTLGVWTFNAELYPGYLPLQTWAPEDRDEVVLRTVEFLRQQQYKGPSQLNKALDGMYAVLKNSELITIFLISNGEGKMQGTPFDADINAAYSESIKEMKKDRKPIVTVLRAKSGRVVKFTVNALPWPVVIPEIPIPIKAVQPPVEAAPAVPIAALPTPVVPTTPVVAQPAPVASVAPVIPVTVPAPVKPATPTVGNALPPDPVFTSAATPAVKTQIAPSVPAPQPIPTPTPAPGVPQVTTETVPVIDTSAPPPPLAPTPIPVPQPAQTPPTSTLPNQTALASQGKQPPPPRSVPPAIANKRINPLPGPPPIDGEPAEVVATNSASATKSAIVKNKTTASSKTNSAAMQAAAIPPTGRSKSLLIAAIAMALLGVCLIGLLIYRSRRISNPSLITHTMGNPRRK